MPAAARPIFRRVPVRLAVVGVLAAGLVTGAVTYAAAEEAAPKGPVGWDSYRNPERMTEIGTGARTKQFSSFDRAGNNDDGFVGTYSCLRESDAGCVIAEDTGAGEVDSIWFTRDNGDVSKTGRITIELDGQVVVDAPLQDLVNGSQGAPFVHPLVANGEQSSGGVYIKVPMPYRDSMRITTENNPLFHHVQYRDFADAEGIETFDPSDPAEDVIAKMKDAGVADPKPPLDGAETTSEAVDVGAGETAAVGTVSGPGAISELKFTLPQLAAGDGASDALLHDARLRISFDGHKSVDAPLGEFFGSGLGLHEVRSMMFGVNATDKTLTSWWLMPYRSEATIEIVNESSTAISGGTADVTSAADDRWESDLAPGGKAGYFNALGNRGDTTDKRDHVFADTTGRGRIVGVTETVEGKIETGNIRNYLEGDERLFTDGSRSPEVHGTGTEDFYEGGWYFNQGPFNLPTNGNPAHEEKADGCEFDCTGMYRLFVADGMEFDSSARFSIEHGPVNNEPALLGSTTYMYRQPEAKQTWTDTLNVGDSDSEKQHGYTSDDPGAPEEVSSTFEGHDPPAGATAMNGRATTSPVSFRMKVDPDNAGAVLRRISDQKSSYQAAEVAVDGEAVGTWQQPLGNETQRWLDDSYRLPAAVTEGKSQITVELTPVADGPAWHAATYNALSIVDEAVDSEAPSKVGGTGTETPQLNDIKVNWGLAEDDVYAPDYELYASKESGFTPGEDNLLAKTTAPGFVHEDLGAGQSWYYRVRAVDDAGNAGEFSEEFTGKAGNTLRTEAEDSMPPADGNTNAEAQADFGGVSWSGGAQVWIRSDAVDQFVTFEFEVPTEGTYDLAVRQTTAPDYAINSVALDGNVIGEPFDGYAPELSLPDPVGYGQHELSAGKHQLTVKITGKNDQSSALMAGLDHFDLTLAG